MTDSVFGQISGRNNTTDSFPTVHPSSKDNSVASQLINITAIGFLVLGLTGCAIGGGMSKIDSDPEIITGSITKPVEAEGIDPTDAEAIKLTVVDGANDISDSNLLAWSNPETGNRGTITAIDKYIGTHGQSCKKFRTTVDSFMGISLYNGETCELKKGFWVLSWFIRDKSA